MSLPRGTALHMRVVTGHTLCVCTGKDPGGGLLVSLRSPCASPACALCTLQGNESQRVQASAVSSASSQQITKLEVVLGP